MNPITMEPADADADAGELSEAIALPQTATPELLEAIQAAIAEMQPRIAQDGGHMAFAHYERGFVRVHLSGACTHCHLAGQTLGGLRRLLMARTGLPLRVAPSTTAPEPRGKISIPVAIVHKKV